MSDIRLSAGSLVQGGASSWPAGTVDDMRAVAEGPAVSSQEKSAAPAVATLPKAGPSEKELQRVTEELQQRVGGADAQLQFSIDDSSGMSVVKVTDRTTHEVIRQYPSEEVMQIAKGLDRYKEGLLVNSKA